MDTRKPKSANDFLELARRKTVESRNELFGNSADLFLDDRARLSDRERSLMTGILRSLIEPIESALRHEITAVLAESGDVPEAVRSTLAPSRMEIARPILMRSAALRVPELIEPVKFRGREHRLAIALRPSLTTETAEPLAPNDEDPIEALLHQSDDGLREQASNYLVAESDRIDRLKTPVLALADLPVDLARRMHWWVSAALRTYCVKTLSASPVLIDHQIESATIAVCERLPSDGVAMATLAHRLIEHMTRSEPITSDGLIRILKAGRIPAFIAALAQFANLSTTMAKRIALLGDDQSLAILCRATAIAGDDFQTLRELLAHASTDSARLPADERNSILAFYDKITKGNARVALNVWRRDPEFVSAIEQVGPVAEEPPSSE